MLRIFADVGTALLTVVFLLGIIVAALAMYAAFEQWPIPGFIVFWGVMGLIMYLVNRSKPASSTH